MFPEDELEAILKERAEFQLDQYYESIKPLTIRTKIIPLSIEDVTQWLVYNRTGEEDKIPWRVRDELSSAIDEFGKNGVFVRLSTRSPKDAVDKLQGKLVASLRSIRGDFPVADQHPNSLNHKLCWIQSAFAGVYKVTTVREAFDLFAMSSRTISDMRRAVSYSDKLDFSMKLIVREFVSIPIESEFRGFVCNKQLTALSQYYDNCYFKWVDHNSGTIGKRVQDYFETKVKDKVKLVNYVIDFIVTDDRLFICELNPYSKTTGSCLFDWGKDRNLLENGPFEMRCRREVPAHVEASLRLFANIPGVDELWSGEIVDTRCCNVL